jgi:hypothetical protein
MLARASCQRRSPRMSKILTREELSLGSSNGSTCARKQPHRVLKLRSRKTYEEWEALQSDSEEEEEEEVDEEEGEEEEEEA